MLRVQAEYDIELIGVVPRVETIENATPKDITNNPATNKIILLIIPLYLIKFLFNSVVKYAKSK